MRTRCATILVAGMSCFFCSLPADVSAQEARPQPIFSSGVISAATPGHAVRVDVELQDTESLFLVVMDAGDGIACDFANWAEAHFVTPRGRVDLRELKWKSARTSWGEIRVDFNAEGQPMRIAGKPVRGVGTHASSLLEYAVPHGATRFRALAGVDSQGTEEGCGSTVRFLVYTQRPEIEIQRIGPGEGGADAEPSRAAARFRAGRFFGSRRDQTGRATAAQDLRLLPGFKAELVYTVPIERQGSWVCLTHDDRGRLIASDQHSGLYRITVSGGGSTEGLPRVERLDVDLGGCQGLLYHGGSLFAVVNGDASGLYRLRDTNGDDQFDEVRLLRAFDGAGEHGPHAVVAAPGGESLYIVGGNGCYPGERLERSRVPQVWREDRLLSRSSASDGPWEPQEERIGGWVVRSDLEGRRFELVAMGFRNPYDLAFNRAGELFTFDSDMEWDSGTPWYRPTRINHVISGADFGWRAGTAKWPDHFFDSFGAVVDVGLASPTGVTFGYGARFPEKYQQALLVCDWSLGNIYAVHLTPDGASYTGAVEPFAVGAPLPVTDVVINPVDGALYFTVGGRGVTSALYRVSYEGEPAAAAQPKPVADPRHDRAERARSVRKELEAFHYAAARPDLDAVWPHLGSEDRAIRFAARVALERLPVNVWREAFAAEENPRRRIAASLAYARHADGEDLSLLLSALERTRLLELSAADRADLLRLMTVVLARHGDDRAAGPQLRRLAAEEFAPVFPAGDERLDAQLAEILAFAEGPAAIDPILDALDGAATQEAQMHYAMCLRDIERGWSLAQRERLLNWFRRTAAQRGGVLFGDYLQQIHRVVVHQLGPKQRAQLAGLLELPQPADPYQELKARTMVRQWTVGELLEELAARGEPSSAGRGREVFRAAMCYRCHRMQGQGGMVGPDLSAASRRFNTRDLLESIIEPGKAISDQYRAVQILTDDGRVLTGKVTDIHGNALVVMNDVLDQSDLTTVQRDRILEMSWSATSMMPAGLLDTFTAGEIADLLAFMEAAGASASSVTTQ